MPASRRNSRTWPFTPLGTFVIVPLLAVAILAVDYGFWWFVLHAGDAALMLGGLK